VATGAGEPLEFDYVVVGAGSAGSTLAARLSEDPSVSVAVLEAGPPDKSPLIKMPVGFAFHPPNTVYNWAFDTAPQAGLNGRVCYQPRGRGLGGSSAINAMIYIRGTPADYDGWARLGATGWSFADVLPYFKRAENNERGADALHGGDGPLNVADLRSPSPLSLAFLDAAMELQLPSNRDFNGPRQEGMGLYQVTQKDGRRHSAAAAYLAPAMTRRNLAVLPDSPCERVAFDGRRAIGVRIRRGGASTIVRARREVILAAGAFQSPQILMLSGVGPAAHLKAHGVEIVADSAGVGENLQDHLDYTILRKTRAKGSVGLSAEFALGFPAALRAYLKDGKGPLTTNLAEAGGFVRTEPHLVEPDVQLHFLNTMVDDHGRKKHLGGGFSLHACVLRPKSRGVVRLQSPDPSAPPLIDPRFLSDEDDLYRLMRGARIAQRLLDAPALKAISGEQLYLQDLSDDAALIADIRARADTIYHPVGTCRMGADEAAPLTPDLRVRGTERLRVADASVMPALVSGNTNAPSIMIGEKAADLIRAAR
jgi:choline dehydrogenase-like flavoprotein